MQDLAYRGMVKTSEAIVLGTSNSILRGGWVDGLRETLEVPVRNMSVGASASAFALWQLADSGLPAEDVTRFYFLDTLVNDETFIAARHYDFGWWHYYQCHLMDLLPPAQTVFVGFSSLKYFSHPSPQAVLQEKMCLARGARFISLRRTLLSAKRRAAHSRENMSADDLFEDPGHFHRHQAQMFGSWLGRHLANRLESPVVPPPAAENPLETLVPATHNGTPEERSTSLRKQSTIYFGLNQSFRLAGNRILHGVCLDASNTRCFLNIDSGDANRVSFELAYNRDSGRMQVKFVHFPNPVRLGPQGANVTISAEPLFAPVKGIHSRSDDGPMMGLRLLSFLSGPPVDPPSAPEVDFPEQANRMTDMEKGCFLHAGLIETLENPPTLPKYPRSFIEL